MLNKFALKFNKCTLHLENDMKIRKKLTKGLKMMSISNQSQKAAIFLFITNIAIIKLGNE